LRDQLKAGLSTTAHQRENEEGPSTADLAGKIKSLKAANSIEATPQRVRQKHSTAEEPVTARIRRKAEAIPASGSVTESGAERETTPVLPPEPPPPPSVDSAKTFQERVAGERQKKDEGPGSPG